MGLRALFSQMMLLQRGAMFGWVPVCLAVGVGTFFNLTWEPSRGVQIHNLTRVYPRGCGGARSLSASIIPP